MATPPTFSSGAVLTAAQMNKIGLWLVKTQTIGSAVSSVTVSDAFSADYDNYKIIMYGGVGSTGASITLKLGASATGYYATLIYGTYSGAAVSFAATNNGGSFAFAGVGTANSLYANIELVNPFNAKNTAITNSYVDTASPGAAGNHSGFHNSAVSYTAFTFTASAGTMTGGTIAVYGYKGTI